VSCVGAIIRGTFILSIPVVTLWLVADGVVTGPLAVVLGVGVLAAIGWFMVMANR
jgi:hypothetical protein